MSGDDALEVKIDSGTTPPEESAGEFSSRDLTLPMDTDKELVQACVEKGDQRAWEEFIRRFERRIGSIVSWSKWGFTPGEREEAAQEASINVVRGLRTFKFDCSLQTFVSRVTVNTCISLLRKRTATKRRTELVREDATPEEVERTKGLSGEARVPPQEAALLRDEDRHRLVLALAHLDDRSREMVEMRFAEGLSYQEIARAMEIPEGTVCSGVSRALLRLRDLLR